MHEKINNYKIYYYLFVVFLLVGFCIYFAIKEAASVHENYMVVMNEKFFAPPDIVPHIREIKEPEPSRPNNMTRDEWNDHRRAKDELEKIS